MLCIPLYPLESGLIAKVDAKDFWKLADYEWYSSNGYAVRYDKAASTDNRMVYMHREILGLAVGDELRGDHINGDRLDNRRKNLRMATHQQNIWNSRRKKDFGFKGVKFIDDGRLSPWCASICANGVKYRLGYYKTEEEAACAYDEAARKHFGEFARLNFPREGEQSAVA